MKDPELIKDFICISLGLLSLAGAFFAVGKWTGRKNVDSEEIKKLKQTVQENENKNKSRLYGKDGGLFFVRAENYEKEMNVVRAVQSKLDSRLDELNEKQHSHELTLSSIDSNVRLLVELVKKSIKIE